MKIAIVGTGYVGLVTGTCLAEIGHTVFCVDIDEEKIQNLKSGICPIYEEGLESLIKKHLKSGRLKFTTNFAEAITPAKAVFSAVGTSADKDFKADLTCVKQVARQFGQTVTDYKIFMNKSTVPVGTGDLCEEIIQQEIKARGLKVTFDVVANPEFLREGMAVKDAMSPERIIIGTISPKAKKIMAEIYSYFEEESVSFLYTDKRSAELIKYASNAFLATKISFINEIANYAEKIGVDVSEVAKGMGMDSRIGAKFLRAGIGYGGSCFPKDVKALLQSGKEQKCNFQILEAVEEVNKKQKLVPIRKLKNVFGSLKSKTIAILGLSFKPNTNDLRDAPSLDVINALLVEGAQVRIFDPVAQKDFINLDIFKKNRNSIYAAKSAYDACEKADALVILTEWPDFKELNPSKIAELMSGNTIVDGRNVLAEIDFKDLNLNYLPTGKAQLIIGNENRRHRGSRIHRVAHSEKTAKGRT